MNRSKAAGIGALWGVAASLTLCTAGVVVAVLTPIAAAHAQDDENIPQNVQDFMYAVRMGELAKVKQYVAQGINVNVRSFGKSTALMQAASYGEAEIVRFLLSQGADPNLQDEDGLTALARARKQNRAAVAALLQPVTGRAPAAVAAAPAPVAAARPRRRVPAPQPAARNARRPAAPARRVAARPGHIVGSVTPVGGARLGKVTIEYGGFLDGKLANTFANGSLIENVSGKADASGGVFAAKVPPGTYRVGGYSTYNFNGQVYHFPLELTSRPKYDFERLQMEKLRGGLVRNFALKLTGPKPGQNEGSAGYTETTYIYAFYGGRVDLDARNTGAGVAVALREAYPKESRVLVTLTPVRLVDGSAGRVVNIDLPLGDDGKWTFNRRGVVPGTYTATARLRTPDGNDLPLKISLTGQYSPQGLRWQSAPTFTFAPNHVGPIPRMGVDAQTLYLGR